MKRIAGLVVMCALAAPAAAERLPVREREGHRVPDGPRGADGKNTLDLYLPQGATGAPVIVLVLRRRAPAGRQA